MSQTLDDVTKGLPESALQDIRAFRSALETIVAEMVELLTVKRASYGPANLERHGLYGILVRLDDKGERLRQMYQGNVPKTTATGENEQDAWDDILGYSLLAALFLRHGPQMYSVGGGRGEVADEIQRLASMGLLHESPRENPAAGIGKPRQTTSGNPNVYGDRLDPEG
jgi:hypothetical protein